MAVEEVAPERKTKVRRTEQEVEDVPVKKIKSAKAKNVSSLDTFLEAETRSLLSEVEAVVKLNAITFGQEDRMHTGLLCLDLMTGGGIVPGFYTFTGPEQSAKTTAAVTISGASTKVKGLRIRCLWDAENSSGNSLDYIANIYETLGYKTSVDQLFGVRGSKGYIIKPIIEYKDDSSGDTFFNWLYSVLKRLPDKRFDSDRWWYVYESNQVNKDKFKEFIDRTQSSKQAGLWIPAADGSLQALIVLDSFPSLVPSAMDDEEASNAMAVQARMFSKHLPRVKGSFRSKRVALIGINQLRLNPGARFGNPEYEPGGEALKFFCFSGDTLIQTNKGMFTGEELYNSPQKKLLGEAGFEKPEVYDKMGYSQTLTLYTERANRMTGKPGHRVRTLYPHKMELDFSSLEDIKNSKKTNSYVAVKVGGAPTKDFSVKLGFRSVAKESAKFVPSGASSWAKLPTEVTPELSWLLGVLVGDGHVRNGTIQLASTNKQVYEKYRATLSSLFGISCSKSDRTHQAYSKVVSEFLVYLGAGSKSSWQKNVPWSVRQSGRSVWLSFLAGLMDSDFGVQASTLSYVSVSATLVDQVRVMALALGYPNSNGNLKEVWWSHGANARIESPQSECASSADVHSKYKTKVPSLVWYGSTARDFMIEVYPFVANGERYNKFTKGGRENLTPGWRILPIEPFQEGSAARGNDVRIAAKLYSEITGRSTTRIDCWDDSWLPEAYDRSRVLRTVQEREKCQAGLDKIAEVIRYSKTNQIVWDKSEVVESTVERVMTYDASMPDTHTIVTNGIVSHNSDVRFRFYPEHYRVYLFTLKASKTEKKSHL